jgi:hypothetical protein
MKHRNSSGRQDGASQHAPRREKGFSETALATPIVRFDVRSDEPFRTRDPAASHSRRHHCVEVFPLISKLYSAIGTRVPALCNCKVSSPVISKSSMCQ